MVAHVLVAVSDEMIRELVGVIFTRAGYAVTRVTDGPAAAELLTSADRVFDAAVIDSQLQYLSGAEVASFVRERRPGFPVVLLSASAPCDRLSDSVPVLRKPFHPTELVRVVGELIARANPHDA